jgi:hypothetical protein
VPEAGEIYDDHVPASRRPFALHTQKPRSEIKHKVVPPVLDQRLEYTNPEANGSCRDLGFGEVASLIGGVHEQTFA